MDQKTFKRQITALRREYIKANRLLQDGEIFKLWGKRGVILRAVGVNEVTNCQVQYRYRVLKDDGTLEPSELWLYGYEWQDAKSTGEFYEFENGEDVI